MATFAAACIVITSFTKYYALCNVSQSVQCSAAVMVHYKLRENNNINVLTFLNLVAMVSLEAVASWALLSLLMSVPNTFIFSTSTFIAICVSKWELRIKIGHLLVGTAIQEGGIGRFDFLYT